MNISSPFFHKALTTNKVMSFVCLALLPGIFIQTYFFGFGILINLLLSATTALISEALILKLRNRNIKKTLSDNSALLTGLLLGVAIPPTLPFWMTIVGVSFAIIFAKQLYGGLGYNPFNPAMVGYVLLLISFPLEMTTWLPTKDITINSPNFLESVQLIFLSKTTAGLNVDNFREIVDGFTMATPLDHIKTEIARGNMISEITNNSHFSANTMTWFWVNVGFLLGGIILLISKIIRWHIPISFILGISVTSFLLHSYDSEIYPSVSFHLFSGATMLGAFFIATDPVSASTTLKGRMIYGLLIGFLIVVIRTFGGYPDAIAFAVLLLNLAVPTLDHYTKPIVYGHKKEAINNE